MSGEKRREKGGDESSLDRAFVSMTGLTHENEMFPKIKEGGSEIERERMC